MTTKPDNSGLLVIDKPQGVTSHDVVAAVRGALHMKRVGHAGTLDPMATGLLVVFAGRATRAVSFSENHTKCYEAHLRLGLTTDTQDTTGTVLSRAERAVSRAELEAVLPQFRGDIMQVPPMYSALKVNGKKLYELAREGIEIERKARTVHFYEISILEVKLPLVRMEVTCSKGTYIRTLCHDIGEKLGCHGCMEQLIRTRVGQFDRNGAHTLDEIAAIVGEGRLSEILVPVDEMFAALRSFATADDHAKKLAENGNPLKPAQIREIGETASGGDFAEDEEFRLYLDDGTFVGIYQYRPSQNLTRPVKLFLERT